MVTFPISRQWLPSFCFPPKRGHGHLDTQQNYFLGFRGSGGAGANPSCHWKVASPSRHSRSDWPRSFLTVNVLLTLIKIKIGDNGRLTLKWSVKVATGKSAYKAQYHSSTATGEMSSNADHLMHSKALERVSRKSPSGGSVIDFVQGQG